MQKINQELGDFFNFTADAPRLFLADSRVELDEIWGKKTERWFVGATKNGNIYLLNPEIYASESSHPQIEFWQTLKHEYCHVYYHQITNTNRPQWLNEGLAGYLSGKKLDYQEAEPEKLLQIFSYFHQVDRGVYLSGQFWVEYLIKEFGQEKIISLIKKLDKEIDELQFSKYFQDIYHFKYNQSTFSKLIK